MILCVIQFCTAECSGCVYYYFLDRFFQVT